MDKMIYLNILKNNSKQSVSEMGILDRPGQRPKT